MKVLVVYFSQTGNTEKIAQAIHREASRNHAAELKTLDAVDPGTLGAYDLLFVGSPIHAGSLVKEVKDFLTRMPPLPGVKLAGFITHAATVYPPQTYTQMTQALVTACEEKSMECAGYFHCQGYLADIMHEPVRKMQKLSEEEWHSRVREMTGHPDADDEAAAADFARELLS